MATSAIASPVSAWEAATRAEQFARAVMNQYREEILVPVSKAMKAGEASYQNVLDAEEGWAPYTNVHADAVCAVITTPAPDMAALVAKVEMGIADGVFDSPDISRRMVMALADDIRRFASVGGQA